MSWVRLDDKTWSHPKFAGLGAPAVRLWVFALCWCNQQESDGRIPSGVLSMLSGRARDAAELVERGLWEVTPEGWQVHDYLDFQPSSESLQHQRTLTRERITRHRERSRNGVTGGVTNGTVTEAVRPTPIPTQPNPTRSDLERPVAKAPTKLKVVRWRRVPEDWNPKAEHQAIASAMCISLTLEAQKFRDHEFATPKTDPDATFRNWLRNAKPAVKPVRNGFQPPGPRTKLLADGSEAELYESR